MYTFSRASKSLKICTFKLALTFSLDLFIGKPGNPLIWGVGLSMDVADRP